MIVSLSTLGGVHVWTVPHQENWSAFAPDFQELDTNIECHETEEDIERVSLVG